MPFFLVVRSPVVQMAPHLVSVIIREHTDYWLVITNWCSMHCAEGQVPKCKNDNLIRFETSKLLLHLDRGNFKASSNIWLTMVHVGCFLVHDRATLFKIKLQAVMAQLLSGCYFHVPTKLIQARLDVWAENGLRLWASQWNIMSMCLGLGISSPCYERDTSLRWTLLISGSHPQVIGIKNTSQLPHPKMPLLVKVFFGGNVV